MALSTADLADVRPVTIKDEILDVLGSFEPGDDLQRSYLLRMLDLAGMDGDPASRELFDPGHFTASGFVASPDGREVLLLHHEKIGKWLQPGGHIEPDDESIEGAMRREIEEETGLAELESLGLIDIDIHEFPARRADPAHLHFDIRFGFVASSVKITTGDGALDVRWIPFNEVPDINPSRSIVRPTSALRALIS